MREKFERVAQQVKKARYVVEANKQTRDNAVASVTEKEKKIQEVEGILLTWARVNELLVNFSDVYKRIVIERIQALITEGLQAIREDPKIFFKVTTEVKRGNLDVSFKVWDEELQHEVDLKNDAGSVRQIVSTLLRIVLIMLTNSSSAPIILDEVGDGISIEYQENFGKFLNHLSHKLEVQIILITHRAPVASFADKGIHLERNKGVTRIVTKE